MPKSNYRSPHIRIAPCIPIFNIAQTSDQSTTSISIYFDKEVDAGASFANTDFNFDEEEE